MYSFETTTGQKICESVIVHNPDDYNNLPNLIKQYNLKIYLNGKRLRKKIIFEENSWRFVKPLKLTKNDILEYTWEIKIDD